MKIEDQFSVDVPVEEAWKVLLDVERIAPCLPGAQLQEIEGDEYRGIVKIKVGPITAQYKGKATFLSKDDANHIAVLKAEGRDTKGQGNASATITATLKSAGSGTDVVVSTELTITGKVAQFGRGVLADVSAKILNQFVNCLEHDVLATPEETVASVAAASAAADEPAAPTIPAPTIPAPTTDDATEPIKPAVRKIEYKPTEPVDLLGTAGAPVVKRAAPVVAILFLLVWLLRRRKKS